MGKRIKAILHNNQRQMSSVHGEIDLGGNLPVKPKTQLLHSFKHSIA